MRPKVITLLACVQLAYFPLNTLAEDSPQLDPHVQVLTSNCYQHWLLLDWKVGQQQTPAKDSLPFSNGIKRVSQARAELFLEGYQLSPTIEPDSQEQVFPLVYQLSVEEIKTYLKQYLPALKLI